MKYLVVTRESERRFMKKADREVIFIVHPEEEMKIRAALREAPNKMDIVLSKQLDDEASYAELSTLLTRKRVLAVSTELETTPALTQLLLKSHIDGMRVIDFESALMELVPCVPSNHADLVKFLAMGGIHQDWKIRAYKAVKNAGEPAIAALLLLLLSPILVLVAIAIKLTSPGPVLYGQKRLGLDGEEFEIFKFRSMRTDAEKNGPVWASAKTNDARLTPIGGFLRASHLDELPQFINILRGEISFIGPRPERKIFSDQLLKDVPTFTLRTLVKPGISGWAQTRQGYANSVEDSRKKLELDLYYVLKHSARLDALIVLNTLGVISTGGTEGKKREVSAAVASKAAAAQVSALQPLKTKIGFPFRIAMLSLPFRYRLTKAADARAASKAARSNANQAAARSETRT